MFSQKYQTLCLVLFVIFLDYVGLGIVYPLFSSMLFSQDYALLPLAASQGERGFYLGLLITCMPLVLFFVAPFIGSLSDRIGRKKIIVACALVGVLGYALSCIAVMYANIWLLLASRAIIGISAANVSVVSAVITDISEPEERTRFFGWFNMALGLGLAAGPFIGGLLTAFHTDSPVIKYSMPFAITTCIFLLIAVLAQTCIKETFAPKEKKANPTLGQLLHGISKGFMHPQLSKIFMAIGLFSFGWSFYWEFIPVTWIEAYNFSTFDIGSVYGFAAGIYALSCGAFLHPLSLRFKADNLFLIGLVGCSALFALMGIIQASFWIWILVPFQQIFVSLLFPTSATMLAEHTKEDEQGEMQGIRQSVMSLAFALAPILSGSLLAFSVNSPIYVGIASMLAAAGVVSLSKLRQERAVLQ